MESTSNQHNGQMEASMPVYASNNVEGDIMPATSLSAMPQHELSNPYQSKPLEWVRNPSDGSVLFDHKGKPISIDRILASKPLRGELCTRPGPGNKKLTYMSGEGVTRTLNDVFGYDGWNLEITRVQREECTKDAQGRYCAVYTAQVKVTHKASGTYKEDCGAGDAIDRSFGTAVSNALKSSITDAMKRAARHFGDKLGNALYEGKFNASKAPATLKEALDRQEIDRANCKFGFAKDQTSVPNISSSSIDKENRLAAASGYSKPAAIITTPSTGPTPTLQNTPIGHPAAPSGQKMHVPSPQPTFRPTPANAANIVANNCNQANKTQHTLPVKTVAHMHPQRSLAQNKASSVAVPTITKTGPQNTSAAQTYTTKMHVPTTTAATSNSARPYIGKPAPSSNHYQSNTIPNQANQNSSNAINTYRKSNSNLGKSTITTNGHGNGDHNQNSNHISPSPRLMTGPANGGLQSKGLYANAVEISQGSSAMDRPDTARGRRVSTEAPTHVPLLSATPTGVSNKRSQTYIAPGLDPTPPKRPNSNPYAAYTAR